MISEFVINLNSNQNIHSIFQDFTIYFNKSYEYYY